MGLESDSERFVQNPVALFFGSQQLFFALAVTSHNQFHGRQGDAAVKRGSGANAVLGEVRFRRRLMIGAHRREVLEIARLLCERVLLLPDPVRAQLFELQAFSERLQTKLTRRILLLRSGRQPKRLQKRISETHIGKPWLVEVDAQGKVMAEAEQLISDQDGQTATGAGEASSHEPE